MTRWAPRRLALAGLCLAFLCLFAGLGIWQVQRLGWKQDLIAKVEARLAAPPRPLFPAASWSRLDAKALEYTRVRLAGRFDHGRETLVDALTERGPGYWVITPLATREGIVLVNRGFVPRDRRDPATRAAGQAPGEVALTGLLRPSEPEGRVLRPNRPAEDAFFSRDVAAIAARRGLGSVAPFFVDADSAPNPGGFPLGGMTVVRFPDNHLVYALTWFALAILSLVGLVLTVRISDKRG